MSVVPAWAAGVRRIQVASPHPGDLMLAAAAIAGAERVLGVGGAQAIAALAYGTETVERCDLIVGPGNKWVSAAKKLVYGDVGIDMLAGPSELVVLADASADPELVAGGSRGPGRARYRRPSHPRDGGRALRESGPGGPCAPPRRVAAVRRCGCRYFARCGARAPCARGSTRRWSSATASRRTHLEVMISDPGPVLARLENYGALFVGLGSAEVFGDYGLGPNHILPTSGGARFSAGLSVLTFLRAATWMELDSPAAYIDDTVALARLEGLEGHARAAELRRRSTADS